MDIADIQPGLHSTEQFCTLPEAASQLGMPIFHAQKRGECGTRTSPSAFLSSCLPPPERIDRGHRRELEVETAFAPVIAFSKWRFLDFCRIRTPSKVAPALLACLQMCYLFWAKRIGVQLAIAR